MNDWLGFLNTSISGAAFLLGTMGLLFTVVIPRLDRWSRRFFIIYFIVFLLCDLSAILEIVFQHYDVSSTLFSVMLVFESLMLVLPLPLVTVYLLHCCSEDPRSSNLFRAVLGLLAVCLFVLISVLFSDGIITITPDNHYYRGPLYPLLLAPMIAIILLNFVATVRRRVLLTRNVFYSFLIAQLPMIAAIIVQMFIDFFSFLAICYILSALAMYGFILSDRIEQDLRSQREIARQQAEIAQQQAEIARQQTEIARQRASVMVLQMRPHFIYNTLMSIHSLCRLNPRKAEQITMDFTNYLRRNFNAVASDSAIPFSTELEHTRAYLCVEQALYDEMLLVEYDTQFTRFRIPPLTLQPIVENAVKHGLDPDSNPLQVTIRTFRTDSAVVIIVEDNGPGFDPATDSEPHTTLANIRQRLEWMCAGTMEITLREAGGTMVKVTIPNLNVGKEP